MALHLRRLSNSFNDGVCYRSLITQLGPAYCIYRTVILRSCGVVGNVARTAGVSSNNAVRCAFKHVPRMYKKNEHQCAHVYYYPVYYNNRRGESRPTLCVMPQPAAGTLCDFPLNITLYQF